MKEKILLFIPAYNCEKQIARTLAKFNAAAPDVFTELLIIENRSTDNTLAVCQREIGKITHTKTTLIQNRENYNLGGSHKVAFNYALDCGFDYVAILHGDDQGDIADLVPRIQRGEHRLVDNLLGARFMPQSKLIHYSRFRTFGNLVFNQLFSLIWGKKLYDLGSGLNLYSTRFLQSRFYLHFPNALTFNYYLVLYSLFNQTRISFFPLTWREEDQVSNVKLFKQARRLLLILAQSLFSRRALINRSHVPPQEYAYQIIATN